MSPIPPERIEGLAFRLIQRVAAIEDATNDILAWEFCSNKDDFDLFHATVLSGSYLTLEQRKSVLRSILKLRYNAGKAEGFRHKIDSTFPFKALQDAQNRRNMLAHHAWEAMEEGSDPDGATFRSLAAAMYDTKTAVFEGLTVHLEKLELWLQEAERLLEDVLKTRDELASWKQQSGLRSSGWRPQQQMIFSYRESDSTD